MPCLRCGQLPQVEEPERAAERLVTRHLGADVAGAEDDAPHQQGGDGAQAHACWRRRQVIEEEERCWINVLSLSMFYLNCRIIAK